MNSVPSRYERVPKRAAPANQLIVSARVGSAAFWIMVTIFTGMIVSATYWLLTHPVTT